MVMFTYLIKHYDCMGMIDFELIIPVAIVLNF